MNNWFSLDLETSPTHGDLSNGYALEPWRVRQGKAFVSNCTVIGPDYKRVINRPRPDQLVSVLNELAGQEVWAHNAVFDIAWLITSIEPSKLAKVPKCIESIRWRDTRTLAKWITNGLLADEQRLSYSLKGLVKKFLGNEPGAMDFVTMKSMVNDDPSSPYWTDRALLDVTWTLRLAKFLWNYLKPEQRAGFIIECASYTQIADSWCTGLRVDTDLLEHADQKLSSDIKLWLSEMGISKELASSPTQLGRLIYADWNLPVIKKTPSGNPSCDADTLKLLAYQTKDDRLLKLMKIRENLTLISKYINTTWVALERTGDGYIYPSPKPFGTLTGRLTYSNETLDGQKVSIAIHQLPRKAKIIRNFLLPPEGMQFAEFDAMAQESRIMAIWSADPVMIDAFVHDKDLHAIMASEICGMSYESILLGKKKNDPKVIEYRQMGKLTNLSSNFRISGLSLSRKAFTEYDIMLSDLDGRKLSNLFKQKYENIPKYWKAIINFAKQNGYTYTLAQRRYKVPTDRIDWKVEGTIISHPIQGTAAEQMYAALASTRGHKYIFNLHDGQFFAVREVEEADEIEQKLNSIDYDRLWNVNLPIKLPFEKNIGKTLGEVK